MRYEEEILVSLKPLANPKLVGGNVLVEVDDKEYRRGVEDLKFSIVGRLSLQ